MRAQGFGGYLAYRVGTTRSQRLQLVHGQVRYVDRAVAIPSTDVENATTKIRCSEREKKIERSIEIDGEISISIPERLGDARARSEMNDCIRANRRNLFAELRVAHVLMLSQGGEGPSIPMFRGRMPCKDPAHETRVARDQQFGHGVGRGRLRGFKKGRAALFMLPGS